MPVSQRGDDPRQRARQLLRGVVECDGEVTQGDEERALARSDVCRPSIVGPDFSIVSRSACGSRDHASNVSAPAVKPCE